MRVPKMSTDSSMDMSVIKKPLTSTSTRPNQTLRDHVEMAMRNYFANLDGERVNDVYEMVLAEVETPLLEVVLEYTRTLRKKLKQHGLMN